MHDFLSVSIRATLNQVPFFPLFSVKSMKGYRFKNIRFSHMKRSFFSFFFGLKCWFGMYEIRI